MYNLDMEIKEMFSKLKPGTTIEIKSKKYKILQHIVWWQAKCNQNYDKYVLEDETDNHDYRIFISGDFVGISKIFHHSFVEPMPKKLIFEDQEYTMTQDEFCIVRKTEGQEFYKIGDAEIWWDYASDANDCTGLSLGRNLETLEREDLKTQELSITEITVLGLQNEV